MAVDARSRSVDPRPGGGTARRARIARARRRRTSRVVSLGSSTRGTDASRDSRARASTRKLREAPRGRRRVRERCEKKKGGTCEIAVRRRGRAERRDRRGRHGPHPPRAVVAADEVADDRGGRPPGATSALRVGRDDAPLRAVASIPVVAHDARVASSFSKCPVPPRRSSSPVVPSVVPSLIPASPSPRLTPPNSTRRTWRRTRWRTGTRRRRSPPPSSRCSKTTTPKCARARCARRETPWRAPRSCSNATCRRSSAACSTAWAISRRRCERRGRGSS